MIRVAVDNTLAPTDALDFAADVAAKFEELSDLSDEILDLLSREGVILDLVARRLGELLFPKHAAIVTNGRGGFAFAEHDAPGASGALIFPSLDEADDVCDLCAWRPSFRLPLSWRGGASVLRAFNPFGLRDAIRIHATVLDWLLDDCLGAVVVDIGWAAPFLREVELEVKNAAWRKRLDAALTIRPRISIASTDRRRTPPRKPTPPREPSREAA